MILTEEEAKTKRCQESFGPQPPVMNAVCNAPLTASHPSFYGGGAGYVATQPGMPSPVMCIGSACMAWRWKRGSLYHPAPPDPDNPGVSHFTEIENRGDYSKTHGFCGKAGRP